MASINCSRMLHKRGGAAGRKVEPAQQFLPARLGRLMDLGRRCVGGLALPGFDRGLQRVLLGPEALRQRFEKCDTRPDGQFRVTRQNFAGERDAGRLAAAGQQVLAERNQIVRSGGGIGPARTGAIEQGAPAVRNGLQQLAKK